MDKRTFSGGTAAAFLTVPLFLLPAEAIPRFGEWLRELSLSGAAGNILAWPRPRTLRLLLPRGKSNQKRA